MYHADRDRDIIEAAEASVYGSVIIMVMPESAFSGDPGEQKQPDGFMVNSYETVAVRAGEI